MRDGSAIVFRRGGGHTRGMEHQGTVIRPPSEGDSILIQATLGCSHGRCAFCGAYRDKPFSVRPFEAVLEDLRWASRNMPRHKRLFFCDGDVLALPTHRLMELLAAVRELLPQVRRVAMYASARNLRGKSPQDLRELRDAGLRMVYMGLESGSEPVLERMNKGSTVTEIVAAGQKAVDAGLKLNVTVLNGLGGTGMWERHARETGRALCEMRPHQAAALTLMPIPGTPLDEDIRAGRFRMPDARGMLRELHAMVEEMEGFRGLLLANHASNHAPFRARMPSDRERVLASLARALEGREALRPEWSRGL